MTTTQEELVRYRISSSNPNEPTSYFYSYIRGVLTVDEWDPSAEVSPLDNLPRGSLRGVEVSIHEPLRHETITKLKRDYTVEVL